MTSTSCIDAFAHGSALLLTIAAQPVPQDLPDRLSLTVNGRVVGCEATAWRMPSTPRLPAALGVLASLPEMPGALPRRLVATLLHEEREIWSGQIAPRTLVLRDLADPGIRHEALQGFAPWLAAGLPGLLDRDLSFAPIGSIGRMRLTAVAAGAGFVLEGFIEGDATRRFHIVSCDLTIHLAPDERVVHRPAPQAIKRTARPRSPIQPGDWTLAVGAGPMPADARFYLVEETGPDRAACHGPFVIETERDESKAVALVHEAFGDIRSLPTGAVDRLYRPLLALPKGPRHSQRFTFGPRRQGMANPAVSVIVPFYGDAFFLHCLFHLQRLLPPTFEIVVVVDDVRLRDACYLSLSQRSDSIAVPTILLCNERNYGYGPSNDLGARAASGEVLILMNSDVLVLDPAPLVEAAERIRTHRLHHGQELVLGFSLLYEDRTVQHLGMTFARSAAMNDLF
ncbi:MAG: glycosyltransferase, partial [Microvirga sp.]